MVVKEFLDSDRVNFLIWRYLLEGNYPETAAKFQKEWHVREPHQDFDFAPHVKGHALITIINRGLLYYALERERQRASLQLPQHRAAEAESLQVGIFGPLVTQPPAKVEDDGVAAPETATAPGTAAATATATATVTATTPPAPTTATAAPRSASASGPPPAPPLPTTVPPSDDAEVSRKRSWHQLPNGSPVKRPRLSNGEHTTDAATATTPMEVDPQDQQQQHDNHAYPSPLEGEQVSTPIVHTEGPEQGTQVDKVEELTPETTFIKLTDDVARTDGDAQPESSPTTADANAGAANAPILLHCEWNPRDPSVLAAAGTDALARVWTVSRVTASDSEPAHDHVSPSSLPLLDPEVPLSTTVTALSWTSDGASLAVATDAMSHASVNVYASDGTLLQTFDPPEPPVIKLCWNPSNTALLAISPDKNGALVTVYYAASGSSLSYLLSGYDITNTPLDASWTNDAEFLLCGGDTLMSLYCAETIEQARKFETKEEDSFTQVLFDWRSKLAATASDKGTLDLWDESGQRRSISAHQGAITSMAWQPLPLMQPNVDDERLIATGGEDCAILIWNARRPESKARCFLTMDSPIVRLAFTPDGAFIAGATSSQVLIWKVGNSAVPRATWSRPQHAGWQSPKAGSEAEEEDEHCLCWDASGQKLAYGSASKLAVINFSR